MITCIFESFGYKASEMGPSQKKRCLLFGLHAKWIRQGLHDGVRQYLGDLPLASDIRGRPRAQVLHSWWYSIDRMLALMMDSRRSKRFHTKIPASVPAATHARTHTQSVIFLLPKKSCSCSVCIKCFTSKRSCMIVKDHNFQFACDFFLSNIEHV